MNLATWVPGIPSQLSADAGHCIHTAQKMAARQNSTPKAHDEAPSPEHQDVAVPDYPKNSKSWLSMPPSLRGNGGHGPHPNLPEVPWRTLCMDMPHGSQFDPEAYGSHVPAEFAGRFRVSVLLVILSKADGLILQHVNMPVSTENTTTFSYEC